MTLPSNPKLLARSIAEGHVPFTAATCRHYHAGELKVIYRNLEIVLREIRGLSVPLEDIQLVQRRNRTLQRANTAMMLIRNFAKKHRIVL